MPLHPAVLESKFLKPLERLEEIAEKDKGIAKAVKKLADDVRRRMGLLEREE